MEELTDTFASSSTGRNYKIRRVYTCKSSWVIYLVTCQAYNIQYVGQTTQELRKSHYGHLSDVRNGTAGLGKHFKECHGQGKDLKVNENLDICMEPFSLVVVARVRPPATVGGAASLPGQT
jgi:tripartite motif-containing protein 2/3